MGRWQRTMNWSAELAMPPQLPYPFPGGPKYATYLGTWDFRGFLDLGNGFPDGISIFVSTYDEGRDEEFYDPQWRNSYCEIGAIVPLYAAKDLALVSPPAGVPELLVHSVEACDLLDFPSYAQIPEIYDQLERDELGASGWLNVYGCKIGGYPAFIQQDLIEKMTAMTRPSRIRRLAFRKALTWHFIGTFSGLLEGDGLLYILAGWDPNRKAWRWHAEWQND